MNLNCNLNWSFRSLTIQIGIKSILWNMFGLSLSASSSHPSAGGNPLSMKTPFLQVCSNLTNILRAAFFVRTSFWQLFLVTFCLWQKICTKKVRVKRWWNHRQVAILNNILRAAFSYQNIARSFYGVLSVWVCNFFVL